MKSAFVHDWLVQFGGAEKVLEALAEIYPSKIFTLVADLERIKTSPLKELELRTSFIQKLPKATKKYRSYLPLFPLAIEQFDLSAYDLVISCSHSIAKGVLTSSEQLHICYCHTPMRYAWDLYQQYLREAQLKSGVKGIFAKFFLHYLRMWDAHAALRVNVFVANSKFIARRIKKTYGYDSQVIYPPVEVERFKLSDQKEDFYLTASRFVPYKKVDLIVEAFSYLPDKKLVVVGDGPDLKKIKEKAGPNVELIGYQEDEALMQLLQKARAFVFAAVEDFGLLPVEAQACGTPVIAFGKGGALETVIENKTGLFFHEQNMSSLIEAVHSFEQNQGQFDPNVIHQHAQAFGRERFQREFKSLLEEEYRIFSEQKDSY